MIADHPAVTIRYFDAEAYNTQATDIIMFQTSDLWQYQSVVERLRVGPFWGTYFEVVLIVPSIEDAYATFYGQEPVTARLP